MAIETPVTTRSLKKSVLTAQGSFAAGMAANEFWRFISTTACWIKQGHPSGSITCVAKASMADTDYITITDGTTPVLYEFDTVGDGVTGGRVQVNISGATTAAQVAAILRTAILASQPYITVVDNGDGTLTLSATTKEITITENVANGGFAVSFGPQASAAAGSMYVGPNEVVRIDGSLGSNLSVIRNAADGDATLTPMKYY